MAEHDGSRHRTAPRHPALDSPELYTNRELSWLQFNERVLELAEDERTPLLERVKFLAIYASNLDEFFMVRVAGLHDQVDAGIDARGPDGLLAAARPIERIVERTRELGRRHSRSGRTSVRPALAEHGIRVIDCERVRPRRARGDRPAVRRADLPGAHPARRRPGPALPLHLEPVAVAGRLAARPGVAAPRPSRA